MKKNVMMRVASLLMVCVLATTCGISGTFAKYVTADDGSDSARVAKWGVKVAVATDSAFGEKYNDAIAAAGEKVVSIGAADDANDDSVLAPGTYGTLGTADISGKPEVMVDVIVDVDLEIEGWVINSTENYFPVVIKVGSTTVAYAVDADADDIEEAVEAAVIKAITGNDSVAISADGTGSTATQRFDANHDFGAVGTDVTVGWAWEFQGSTESGSGPAGQLDVKDTALGDQAALATAATISFTYSVTVTQVD